MKTILKYSQFDFPLRLLAADSQQLDVPAEDSNPRHQGTGRVCLLSVRASGALNERLLSEEDGLYSSATLLQERGDDAPPVDLRQYCR